MTVEHHRATTRSRHFLALLIALTGLLAACRDERPPPPTPEQVRARILQLLPATVADRRGWAADIQAAFAALKLDPSPGNICSVLAVTEQESTFRADPPVPGLGAIALKEIERRTGRHHVPAVVVRAALELESPDGRSWSRRIGAVRTEKELSDLFEEMIDRVPMGRRLLASANPVRTGGPMQVAIAFAERHARAHGYPYPVEGSIRREVFTRRGGMYFGIAHLLGYPAPYDRPLYRFADYNAGQYASRNAAFQNAVATATGIELALDGDLVAPGSDAPGPTEVAVRSLSDLLGMTDAQIHRALAKAEGPEFAGTDLYERVFDIAERMAHRPLPRAVMPEIRLQSPKISRRLTTGWFAGRVDERYRRCMARAGAKP